jgi:hypothetical protein
MVSSAGVVADARDVPFRDELVPVAATVHQLLPVTLRRVQFVGQPQDQGTLAPTVAQHVRALADHVARRVAEHLREGRIDIFDHRPGFA